MVKETGGADVTSGMAKMSLAVEGVLQLGV